MNPYYDDNGITLYLGDCREILPAIEAPFDCVLTDPPYGLEFMGKDWDLGIPGVHFWQIIRGSLKPGGLIMSFGGTRTFHRLTCAIEDAGFEIRDCLMWLYGSGFPKSLDISKAIDKAAGVEREVIGRSTKWRNTELASAGRPTCGEGESELQAWDITAPATPEGAAWNGWGTALKPAWEPIILAMRPLEGTFAENALQYGVAGLNIDGGRIPTENEGVYTRSSARQDVTNWRMQGYKGPLKASRFPANVIHDGSPEVLGGFPETTSGSPGNSIRKSTGYKTSIEHGTFLTGFGDSGSAARFFYCAKASRSERNAGCQGLPAKPLARSNQAAAEASRGNTIEQGGGSFNKARYMRNNHPTVKPLALLSYLLTLLSTPTGGRVLDPFSGSGSMLVAARQAGRGAVGIEISEEYAEITARRLEETERIETQRERQTVLEFEI